MKKPSLILLPALLLVAVAGVIYLPRMLKDRNASATATSPAAASLDLQVSAHEAEVIRQPNSEEARRSLISALFKRGEATRNAADFDRAWREFTRAEVVAPGSPQIAALRVKLMRSERRFRRELQGAAFASATESRQNNSTHGDRGGVPRTQPR